MKVSRRMKIISGIALITGVMALIACSSVSTPSQPQTASQWEQKYPEVFNNAGYSKLIESASLKNSQSNLSESYLALRGTVTNPFGIRDDVLDYTLNYFQGNESAIIYGIKLSQVITNLFLSNNNQSAKYYYNETFIMSWCVWHATSLPIKITYVEHIDKILRNTPERDQQFNKVEKLLSGGIYGYGDLTDLEISKKCNEIIDL